MGKTATIEVTSPLDTLVREVMLPYQREDILSNDRFRWANWSRRSGKSTAKTLRRILRGVARRRDQIFLSAGMRQSIELMTIARKHCEALKLAFSVQEGGERSFEGERYTQLTIHLPELGMRIIGLPANPMTARGYGGDVLFDEFAMHQHDREIWSAVFPSALRGKGEVDVASTPRGRQNLFYELGQNQRFAKSTVTIHDAIEQGLTGIDLDEERQALGDDAFWRQEYECEFVDEATAFIPFALIDQCHDEALPRWLDVEALRDMRGDVVVGIDVGRKHDLTVLWAFEQRGSQLISLGLIELSGTPFREQYDRCREVLSARCVRHCCIDSTGLGMQLAEQLAESVGAWTVEACNFTAPFKEQIASKLRIRMEARDIRIPADRRIRDDLHSVEKSITVDGNMRLRALREEGSHADRFWAAALACHAGSDFAGKPEAIYGPELAGAALLDDDGRRVGW